MNFGNNLKLLRKKSKMSQEDLAFKIGVTRQSVSKWETGEAYPEMTNIVCLCKIFHCEITDLINDSIVDTEKFDKETQEEIIKFKKEQQLSMKRISKLIYTVANVCRIVLFIPVIALIIGTLLFPILSSHFTITEDYVEFFSIKKEYSIENNVIIFNGTRLIIDTNTNLEDFLSSHGKVFYVMGIEYILLCMTVLSLLICYFLNSIFKLYKNIYSGDTPFTLENEKIVNNAVNSYVLYFILMKLTALVFMLVTKLDLSIDFNIKDIIDILIVVSIIYLFKYGRMIQVDSKARIYDE